jgi:hypothetical protein
MTMKQAVTTLDNNLIGRYVDFIKEGTIYSGVVEEIKHDQYSIMIVDEFENEVTILVPKENIDYIHEE